jgi:hypothetical protein
MIDRIFGKRAREIDRTMKPECCHRKRQREVREEPRAKKGTEVRTRRAGLARIMSNG